MSFNEVEMSINVWILKYWYNFESQQSFTRLVSSNVAQEVKLRATHDFVPNRILITTTLSSLSLSETAMFHVFAESQ
jgi:hypothetical protein